MRFPYPTADDPDQPITVPESDPMLELHSPITRVTLTALDPAKLNVLVIHFPADLDPVRLHLLQIAAGAAREWGVRVLVLPEDMRVEFATQETPQ